MRGSVGCDALSIESLARAFLCAALVVGCSHKAGPATDGLEDPGLALSERMTIVVEHDHGDCARMGADLKRFLDDNATAITAAKDAEKTRGVSGSSAFAAQHRARIDAISRRLMPALEPCLSNPEVASALSALPAEPHQPVSSDKDLPP